MNAFADVAVTFASPAPPAATRLGNRWTLDREGPGGVWTSAGDAGHGVLRAGSGRWALWAVGDVFAYRGGAREPLARFGQELAEGREEPAQLDAHALVVAWDEAERQLHVWVDRRGTVHAYVGGRPGGVRLATPYAVVAEASSGALDWVGITGFCGFGFYVADRTPLEDVRILRPATHTVFDASGRQVSQERYWDWSFDPDHARSDEVIVDGFHEVWRATLARQADDHRVVVPVSGGLDSRTIVGGLTGPSAAGRVPPALLTYGYSAGSREIAIARRVARARGLPIREEVVGAYLFDRLDEVVGSVEGFSALTLPRQVAVSATIAQLGDRAVGGHWGDVWFDTGGAPGEGAPRDLVDVAFAKFAKRGRGWLLDHVCRPNLGGQDPEELLREVLREELGRLPDLGDDDLTLKALKTEQWSFRWTLASVRAYQLAVPTLLPFYADDVVDFFLEVPSARLAGRRLQKAYLRRHHPDLADIPWQDTGMSLFERPWEPTVALARRAVAKGVRTLRRRPVVERNWEVQYQGVAGRERLGDLLAEGIERLPRVDPEGLGTFITASVEAPGAGAGYALDALATLAAQLEQGGPGG
jgi:hypothetical protein